jgi:hypothetical protein
MLIGGSVYTAFFKCPHKKKSNGVRSGDLGGHSTGPCVAINFSMKIMLFFPKITSDNVQD